MGELLIDRFAHYISDRLELPFDDVKRAVLYARLVLAMFSDKPNPMEIFKRVMLAHIIVDNPQIPARERDRFVKICRFLYIDPSINAKIEEITAYTPIALTNELDVIFQSEYDDERLHVKSAHPIMLGNVLDAVLESQLLYAEKCITIADIVSKLHLIEIYHTPTGTVLIFTLYNKMNLTQL
jgi:hypothetical protein